MGTTVQPTRLARRLQALKAEGRKALITYICAGDPDLDTTFDLVQALAAAGADVVELGVPFSDPLADGPVIQAASQRALAAGTTPRSVTDLVARLRQAGCEVPIVLMGYYNPILVQGVDRYTADCAAAGVDGLIVPDLSHEESGALQGACRAAGVDLVPLLAPTSTPDRVAAIAQAASGFVYCVSLTGVTGARAALSDRFKPLVALVKQHTDLPVGVGFGIATPEHARQVAAVADAVIVGSAVVKLCGAGGSRAEVVEQVSGFVRYLRTGLN